MSHQTITVTRPVSELTPNPLNPRIDIDDTGLEELAASMKAVGVLQPLLVTTDGLVVAGHRRLLAAKRAGLSEVPVIVRDMSEAEQQAIMLVENIQREGLSPVEEARAYRRLIDAGVPRAELARRVGVPAARITARLVLLKFGDVVQQMFHRGDLPMTAASLLARVSDPERCRQIATRAAAHSMTMAQLGRIVDEGAGALGKSPPVRERALKATTNLDVPVLPDTPGRKGTLERMASLSPEATVTLGAMEAAFKDTCCSCGMSDLPEYCSTCPMVQMIDTVLQRLVRAA